MLLRGEKISKINEALIKQEQVKGTPMVTVTKKGATLFVERTTGKRVFHSKAENLETLTNNLKKKQKQKQK